MKNKKLIRLTESDLNQIVKETVESILLEKHRPSGVSRRIYKRDANGKKQSFDYIPNLSKSVKNAIIYHNYVDITYSDDDDNAPGPRLIQPYALGKSKANNDLLRAFQVSGDSLRGEPAWKTFDLKKITSWRTRSQRFFNPPPMQGYDAPDYNENGDRTMAYVILQANFSENDTLSSLRRQTKAIKDAPKISTNNTSGPVMAHQQYKKNVYTSQPNSKKYDMYRKNIENTKNDFNRFDDDIWAKAEAEAQQQNAERQKQNKIQNSAMKPEQSKQGPINTNVSKVKKNKDDEQ